MILTLTLCLLTLTYGAAIPRGIQNLDPKIVGGNETTIDKFPYQVSVQYIVKHWCGGSIINENTILTAAHCTYERQAFAFTVKAGVTDLNNAGKLFFVKKIIQHEQFNMNSVDNDVAILKLTKSMAYSPVMMPIPLQDVGVETPAGTTAALSGWGAIKEGERSISILRMAFTKMISKDTCKKEYDGFNEITDNMICAEMPGIDTCQGDSGGPIVANGKLIGIVSWGRGCARPGSPGVYADISVLRPWIDLHINDS